MRDDVIQKGLIKAGKVFKRMIKSRDINYTEHTVKITKNLMIKFECIRCEMGSSRGEPIGFEIYAIKDGKEVDCCTLHYPPDVNMELLYLLDCYV